MIMKKSALVLFGLMGSVLLLAGCGGNGKTGSTSGQNGTIIVGSKNFTESTILAYILSDLIQAKTNLHVKEAINLGTTSIAESAIRSGDIDMYVEYTGTLYQNYLHNSKFLPADQMYSLTKQQLEKEMGLTLTQRLGFNDGFTLVVSNQVAQKYHLTTDSELAKVSPQLVIGIDHEFRMREPDGWSNLQKVYGFNFKNLKEFDNGIKYTALKDGQIQVTDGFTTDAQISAYNLVALTDDKNIFMQYDAVPIVREATLKQYPQLKDVLNLLGGKISAEEMSHLNKLVAIDHESPNTVAEQFLKQKGLIK